MLEKPQLAGLDQWALQTTWVRIAWNALNLLSAQSTFPNITFIPLSFMLFKILIEYIFFKKPIIYKSRAHAWLSYFIKLSILFFNAQRKLLKVSRKTQWYPRALVRWMEYGPSSSLKKIWTSSTISTNVGSCTFK